jgi:hypothetical protein
VREMIIGENYERNITIRSDIAKFSRGTIAGGSHSCTQGVRE